MSDMDIMARLKKGQKPKPPIGIIYGRAGIGKTTVCAGAPGVIFVQTEDGLTSPSLAHVPTFGLLKSYEEVMMAFRAIAENAREQGWRTVVLDSLDAFDPMVQAFVCKENGWKRLTDGQYGAGKNAHVEKWHEIIRVVQYLRNDVGLGVLMVGHNKPVKISSPEADPYDQQQLTLHIDITKSLVAHSDMVLFATYPTHTVSTDLGFNKKATRAITEQPVFWTREAGAHLAKNRFEMPEKLPLNFEAIAEHVPVWRGQSTSETVQAAE